MHRKPSWTFLMVATSLVATVPVSASPFSISSSGSGFVDMNPEQVSSPITIANFDPVFPLSTFAAVEFTFTINGYTCDGCASPSSETILFAGDQALDAQPDGSQVGFNTPCKVSITGNTAPGSPADSGICVANSTDVTNIINAFNMNSANILSVSFQGPGNAPTVTFCGANCTATVTFFQASDLAAPEPATMGLTAIGIVSFGIALRRRTKRYWRAPACPRISKAAQ
jgi:hypothetical protein